MTSAGIYKYTVVACDSEAKHKSFSFHIKKGVFAWLVIADFNYKTVSAVVLGLIYCIIDYLIITWKSYKIWACKKQFLKCWAVGSKLLKNAWSIVELETLSNI